jgi:hypothetical protein
MVIEEMREVFFTFELGAWVARKAAAQSNEAPNSRKGDERFAVRHSQTSPKLADLLLMRCLLAPLPGKHAITLESPNC